MSTSESETLLRPGLADRMRGMIVGQFLGDAAALGSHWIYNLAELERQFPGGPAGFEIPAEGAPHDGKQPGAFTHYGDGALVLLSSVAAKGEADAAAFGRGWLQCCVPENGYTGYFDSASRGTWEAVRAWTEAGNSIEDFSWQEGADDDQLATASALAPVVAAHWSDPEWPEAVERITRVRQNNPRAVAYNTVHAMLLRELLRGRDLHSAFHWVQEALAGGSDAMLLEARRKLDDAFALKHKDVTEATQELGQSCPLICSFPAAAHAALRFPDDFTGCITAILKAGGDNAGRAAMAGAWLGARVGLDGLPDAWIARLKDRDDIAAHTETIVRRAGMPD